MAALSVFAVSTSVSPNAAGAVTATHSLYWGALMDGDQTYNVYFPTRTWADAPWDLATWDRFEYDAGKKVSLLHYGQPPPWQQAFQSTIANGISTRGAIPFMDMSSKSVSLHSIAAGSYDTSITAWAKAVALWGKPMFLRWNWEMNGTWFPWGAQAAANPADYVNSWRHFHNLVVAAGAHVTWVWCPNIEPVSAGAPLASVYPGDAYVDWTCLDGYNWGTPWKSFDQVFRTTYNHLLTVAPSKPIVIGETGSVETGGSKAAWITGMFAALPTFPAIHAVMWLNWRIYERNVWEPWPIESSAAAQASFRQGITASNFAANNFAALTRGTVAPLP